MRCVNRHTLLGHVLKVNICHQSGMGCHMVTASRRPPDSRLRSSTKSRPSGSRIASGRSRLCRSRISNASYERDGEQVYTIDVIAQHLQPAFGEQGSQPSIKLLGDLSL